MDLRGIFKPGDTFMGVTSVQTDFHVFHNVRAHYEVLDVYPHWLHVQTKKKTLISSGQGHGKSGKPITIYEGRDATMTYGDLVMGGVIDPLAMAKDPEYCARR